MPPNVNVLTLNSPDYPTILHQLPDSPQQLFWVGAAPDAWLGLPRLGVVGSRKITPYGRAVTQDIVTELARAGIVIISGLAYGVDACAHRAALDAGGLTVAVLPGSVAEIYPASHRNLAADIINNGGSLVSEYPVGMPTLQVNFIARNRIVSGLADALLITEAAVNSGSLHTARFALEQGKTVMAVPGNITSPISEGCNNLIKSGATPVTSVQDVFFAMKLDRHNAARRTAFHGSPEAEKLLELIQDGVTDQEELAASAQLDGPAAGSALTMLELAGRIKPLGGGHWTAA